MTFIIIIIIIIVLRVASNFLMTGSKVYIHIYLIAFIVATFFSTFQM